MDPATGFCLDRGGCGKGLTLLSAWFGSLLFQAFPKSSHMTLLVQVAGIIMAILTV